MKPAPEEPDYAANPHDAFFKDVFSDHDNAVAFFRPRLPQELACQIDWKSLELEPGSFVKTELQQIHSDLLFSVRFRKTLLFLYLLFEHQTTVDPLMPLRLLGYLLEIWLKHDQAHGLPLPPVLPFVFHQGPDRWTPSTRFEDLFGPAGTVPDDLLPFLPKFRHMLLDLSLYSPADAESDERLRVVLQLMKMLRARRIGEFFDWMPRAVTGSFPDNLLARVLYYALHSDAQLDVETIYHKLANNPELRNRTMTIADRLIAKGKREGRREGRQEGQEEGEIIGRIRILRELLGRDPLPMNVYQGKSAAELDAAFREVRREFDERNRRS